MTNPFWQFVKALPKREAKYTRLPPGLSPYRHRRYPTAIYDTRVEKIFYGHLTDYGSESDEKKRFQALHNQPYLNDHVTILESTLTR